jgi:hypothetical protein
VSPHSSQLKDDNGGCTHPLMTFLDLCFQMAARDYDPWDREQVVVDAVRRSVDSCVEFILEAIRSMKHGGA